MELIRIIISFYTILMIGYLMLSLICLNHKKNLIEGVSLVISLGSGTIGILLFWLALLGVKPSFPVILIILGCTSAVLIFLSIKKRHAKFAIPNKLKKNELIFLAIASLIWIGLFSIVVMHSVMVPNFDIDSYALWGLKTKALIHEGLTDGGLFTKLPLSYSHLNYPLMVPFIMSTIYCSVYETNDILCKLIFPFLYIGLTLSVFSTLRWKLKRIPSILLATLFLSMPALIRWTGAGIADVPLTLFYMCSIHYLVKYLNEHERSDFILALLFTLFCSFCKNEGLAIAGINICIFIFFNTFFPFSKDKLKESIYFICGLGILMIPWFLWSRGIPDPYEDYNQRLLYFFKAENIKRIVTILKLFIHNFFSLSAFFRWGILWILLPVAAILNYRKLQEKYVIAMWLLLILHIGAYLAVFIISPWSPELLAKMALERILLHVSPAAIYLIAYHFSEKKI